jgi:hypothetical protein
MLRRIYNGLFVGSLLLLTLASCGGGGGGSAYVPAASTTSVSGSVYAAPVSGATVVVLNSTGTTTIAGPVSTYADGSYTVQIPASALSSDLIFSSHNGTFTDEATGTVTTAGTLQAYVAAGALSTGSGVYLDPASTIVASLVQLYGKTLNQANTLVSQAFGYVPDSSIAPRNQPSSGNDQAQRLAALHAMAYSQLTKDLGFGSAVQFNLLEALADDLADGTLDGMNGANPVSLSTGTLPADIENRFTCSLVSLISNTAVNLTGLNEGEIGTLPFAKVASSSNYRVEYMQMGMMDATQGKTMFKIKLSNLDGSPAPGKMITLMPKMHMAGGMSHATPLGAVIDNGDGTYTCTAYYLMASGPGMGYWELKVMIGMNDSVMFYPSVGMAMGDTTRTTLTATSSNDTIASGMSMVKRSYYLFNDGLSGTTGFNLFIAAKESMMSYPVVSLGTVLSNPTGTITSMSVRASTDANPDPALKTWIDGTSGTNTGQWSFSGLTNLASGVTGTIYVQLTVNGEQKTLDGLVSNASGTNTYAAFVVTPK